MLKISVSPRYEKDCERICRRQFYDKKKHMEAEFLLILGEGMPEEYNDHKLKGDLAEHRLIHIGGRKSRWVLLYKTKSGLLLFERTGTHEEVLNIE
jgi:addiction module RelE/StbE family toxin